MSWQKCFTGSNNIHDNSPPLMSDGRNFSDYQTESNYQEKLQLTSGINSNWEYRAFLTKQASDIIKQNKISACDQSGSCIQNDRTKKDPSIPSDNQVSDNQVSDLKNNYLTRYNLQSRMVTPIIRQDQLLMNGHLKPN